jgi:hypothetical protein
LVTEVFFCEFLFLNICLKIRLGIEAASGGRGWGGVFVGEMSGEHEILSNELFSRSVGNIIPWIFAAVDRQEKWWKRMRRNPKRSGSAGNLSYTVPGAIGSLFGQGKARTRAAWDNLLDRILEGKRSPFFCSQFVVLVFQFCAEQMGIPASSVFNYFDPKVNPALLAADLSRNGKFTEAGYMLPRER